MSATQTRTTLTPNCIDFINKNNARSVFLGLFKHISDAGRTNSNEHLNKIRTRNCIKRNLCFTGNSLGEQCFTRTRVACHQYASRNPATQLLKPRWITQKFNQLPHFFFGFVDTCNISKRNIVFVLGQHSGFTTPKRQSTAPTTTLHLSHKEYPNTDQQQ